MWGRWWTSWRVRFRVDGNNAMPQYRSALPQMGEGLFLADGGLETTLIFHDRIDLPDFNAFPLLADAAGSALLRKYYRAYAQIAQRHRTGLVLESATWRASADWAARLSLGAEALAEANRQSISMLEAIRDEFQNEATPIVISGQIGPRGDGYVAESRMSADEATAFHGAQVNVFATTEADMVCGMTMNYVEEAIGIARAAALAQIPVAISFTVETDGRLPTGQSLGEAIAEVDGVTAAYPSYYMVNCAHPSHFERVMADGGPIARRLRGVRANASRMSHAELNEAPDLDLGDPEELGADYVRLKRIAPRLNVLGGCCGTDERHVEQIARACRPLFARA